MTIPSPVAMVASPATRKKENFSEVSTLARKAFDGMEVMDRNQEGETDWTYWTLDIYKEHLNTFDIVYYLF